MSLIKICGLKREEDILAANQVRPDFAGFVFAGTKRRITPSQAIAFRQLLDEEIPSVGVFVNEPFDVIASIADSGAIGMIQLHGQETMEEMERLKHHTGLPVIKALSVPGDEALQKDFLEILLQWDESCVDYLLFDQGAGGSGSTFDWSFLEKNRKKIRKPFFLAGGISIENGKQAKEIFNPYALDVSSSVETDGFKDIAKMRAFTELIRNIER